MNIKKHSDRLDDLLSRCEQEIREAEEKVRALKARRDSLNLMVKEFGQPASPPSDPDKFRDAGITKSVLDTINDLWRTRKDAVTLAED